MSVNDNNHNSKSFKEIDLLNYSWNVNKEWWNLTLIEETCLGPPNKL